MTDTHPPASFGFNGMWRPASIAKQLPRKAGLEAAQRALVAHGNDKKANSNQFSIL